MLLSELLDLTHGVAASDDIEQLPRLVLPKVAAALRADIGAYYVRSASTELRLAAYEPPAFWRDRTVRQHFMLRDTKSHAIGRAIRERAPVVITDPHSEQSRGTYEPFDSAVRSEIVVPIFAADAIVAVLVLSRSREVAFSDAEVLMSRTVGALLTLIYDRAIDRQNREKTVAFLKKAAGIQTFDADAAFRQFLEALTSLIDARFVSVWLHNDLDSTLVIRSFYPDTIGGKRITFDSLGSKVMPIDSCISGDTIHDGGPQVTFDIQRHPRFAHQRFAREHDLRWVISLPISTATYERYGVVNIYPEASQRIPDHETLQIISLLVSPIGDALAVSSLRRLGDVQETIDNVFFQLIESVDKQVAWDNLASTIAHELRCEACSIFLVLSPDRLGLAGSTGIEGNPPYQDVVYRFGEGLTGVAAERKEPLLHYREHPVHRSIHISKFREALKNGRKSRSVIVAPFVNKLGQSLGVIRCNNKEDSPHRHGGRFTRDDVTVLTRIGSMIADVVQKMGWVASKRRELESYVHGIHHDLISPVDGILTQSDWLLREIIEPFSGHFPDPELARRRAGDIIEAAQQVELLVKTIGSEDEDIRITREDVDIRHLLYTCRGWVRNEAKRAGVEVDVTFVGDARIRGDKAHLMRVIYNVLQNAVKYADRLEPERYVAVRRAELSSARLVLDFEDNGIGVLRGDRDRIFLKHERGDNARRVAPTGAGRGLEFVRRILRAHGGGATLHGLEKPTIFRLDFGEQ